MTSPIEQPSNDSWIKRVKFKGSEDVYEFSLLPAKQCSQVFTHFLSIATPVLAAGYQKFSDYQAELEENERLKSEGHVDIPPDLDLFDVSVLLAEQFKKPEFLSVMEGLIIEFKKNGQETSLDKEFRGEFDKYIKLLELAFKENLLGPLVRYLGEKGWSGMLTSLRVLIPEAKDLGKK